MGAQGHLHNHLPLETVGYLGERCFLRSAASTLSPPAPGAACKNVPGLRGDWGRDQLFRAPCVLTTRSPGIHTAQRGVCRPLGESAFLRTVKKVLKNKEFEGQYMKRPRGGLLCHCVTVHHRNTVFEE